MGSRLMKTQDAFKIQKKIPVERKTAKDLLLSREDDEGKLHVILTSNASSAKLNKGMHFEANFFDTMLHNNMSSQDGIFSKNNSLKTNTMRILSPKMKNSSIHFLTQNRKSL
jgi:hypothetical protein